MLSSVEKYEGPFQASDIACVFFVSLECLEKSGLPKVAFFAFAFMPFMPQAIREAQVDVLVKFLGAELIESFGYAAEGGDCVCGAFINYFLMNFSW